MNDWEDGAREMAKELIRLWQREKSRGPGSGLTRTSSRLTSDEIEENFRRLGLKILRAEIPGLL